MTNLLDLPPEIRAQILAYLVGYQAEIPTETYHCQRFARIGAVRKSVQRVPGIKSADCLYYPDLTPLQRVSIELINKRIRQEALAVIALSPSVEYHLDLIVFGQGRKLIPHWTFISKPSRVVDVLKCTVRLHGTFTADRACNGFKEPFLPSHARGIAPLFWAFYELMIQFFKHGPRLRGRHRDHLVKRIVINIQSPHLESDLSWWPSHTNDTDGPGKLSRLMPQHLYDHMTRTLGDLLSCNWRFGDPGEPVYTHVGRIEFYVDGVESSVFDLDALLAEYKETPKSTRPRFEWFLGENSRVYHIRQMWIPLAQKRRAELGLEFGHSEEFFGDIPPKVGIDYKSWQACERIVEENTV